MKAALTRCIDLVRPAFRSETWRGGMAVTRYDLAVPADARSTLAAGWLMLGLASLIGAGVFSILLVLARTPYLQHLFPSPEFFRVALILHVDLSVLVWFLALGGVLWSLNSTHRLAGMGWAALALGALGTVQMSLAPFLGDGAPIMSNYVPVVDDPWFLWGLTLFGGGFALLTLRSLAAVPRVGVRPDGGAALRFGLNAAAVSAAVALIALAWSHLAIPEGVPRKGYFEILFWGGGHVIQFTYTLFMLVAWLWLASESGGRVPLTPRVTLLMFSIALVSVFLTPVIYLAYGVTSGEHRRLLTWLMQFGGGGDPAGDACGARRYVARGRGRRRAAAAARRTRFLGSAVRGRRADRLHGRGQQREDSRALSRLHRRRHPGVDGRGLPAAAAARLWRAGREARDAAALPLRRRPAAARHRPAVVGRLRGAAQGGRRRAGAAQRG
jgi:hypothetical protein